MIPTFFGILLINFGILRLQEPSLALTVDNVSQDGGEVGEMNADQRVASTESYLGRFRMTGRDLPALINTRGFLDKDDMVELLRDAENRPDNELPPSERNEAEKETWFLGRLAVAPLLEILEDDELAQLHGPASLALSLCAYTALIPGDEQTYSADERSAITLRNEKLKTNRIDFRNEVEVGYVTDDPEADAKRERLIAVIEANPERYARSAGDAWGALLFETGFVDFFGKLFTLNLISEQKKENVFTLIGERWQISFGLNILSIIIAWAVSIPLGIRSARRANSLEDRITTSGLFAAWSLPDFFIGTLLLLHLCTDSSYGVQLFPNKGLVSDDAEWLTGIGLLLDVVHHWFLPLVVLTYTSFTALSRYMRGNLLDQLSSDYVRTARAKGASEDRIVYGHALRNSMVTMITLGSGLLASLFGGFLIVEVIFSIQGLGYLLYEAALNNDAPLVMGSVIISVGLLLVSILIADIMYAVVDPRIRSRYA